MADVNRRTVEILAVLAVWAALYLLVVGPLLGDLLGLERAALSGSDPRPSGDAPDTARGWLLAALGVPVLLGYMYVRAHLAGTTMGDFWNP